MSTQDYYIKDPANPTQNLDHDRSAIDQTILNIISSGVNNIVLQIKQTLGNDIISTDSTALSIYNALEAISASINTDLTAINTSQSGRPDPQFINIFKDPSSNELKSTYPSGPNIYFDEDPAKTRTFDSAYFNRFNFQSTLDDNTVLRDIYNTANPDHDKLDTTDIDITDPAGMQKLKTRLINCQSLEVLYLKKHDELMRTFVFTLNLFDKHKYAIKVLLYLLKSLVNKNLVTVGPPGTPIVTPPTGTPHTGTPPTPITIKLPKTIIKNINLLLEDQEAVQKVIGNMKTSLDAQTKLTGLIGQGATNPGVSIP